MVVVPFAQPFLITRPDGMEVQTGATVYESREVDAYSREVNQMFNTQDKMITDLKTKLLVLRQCVILLMISVAGLFLFFAMLLDSK